ncbi:MAG: tRNA threonylcarbamoyladenosine biosynthesis protein TsaB [Clostridia bacterium]|nr:tRNA threonylcarbamoyladenosine biosynthesis protein TsaB [Clostridia bacterium]
MRVLGLDSATRVAGVALVDENNLIAELFFNTPQDHSRRLLPLLDELLSRAGLTFDDLDGLAVSIGPGSFTGLRIGLATAKGLAQVTGKPLVGIPSLDALASNVWGWPGLICPVINARRQEVYAAVYCWQEGKLCRLTSYQAIAPAALVGQLASFSGPVSFLGDAVGLYRDVWQQLGSRAHFVELSNNLPRAAQVACLGLKQLRAGRTDDPSRIKLLYLRPSAAEANLLTSRSSP